MDDAPGCRREGVAQRQGRDRRDVGGRRLRGRRFRRFGGKAVHDDHRSGGGHLGLRPHPRQGRHVRHRQQSPERPYRAGARRHRQACGRPIRIRRGPDVHRRRRLHALRGREKLQLQRPFPGLHHHGRHGGPRKRRVRRQRCRILGDVDSLGERHAAFAPEPPQFAGDGLRVLEQRGAAGRGDVRRLGAEVRLHGQPRWDDVPGPRRRRLLRRPVRLPRHEQPPDAYLARRSRSRTRSQAPRPRIAPST